MVRATRRVAAYLPRFGTSPSIRSGRRRRPVDVLLDDRHPVVRQVAGELELDPRIVDADVARHDQRVAVALLPERVDDRRHQAQHAAGPLELHQRGPVLVQAVEHLGVDRVGVAQALLVLGLVGLGRELLLLGPVQLVERAGDAVAGDELLARHDRLEQPPAHDLEALLGAGRPPGRLDAADGVAQPVERRAATLAAHLDVVGDRVRGAGRVRRRQADDEQALLRELGRLGQRLGEGEVRLERAARQVALVVELARVGDPLVDQDQARAVVVDELAQASPGLVACSSSAGRARTPAAPRSRRPWRSRAARPARPTGSGRPCRRTW